MRTIYKGGDASNQEIKASSALKPCPVPWCKDGKGKLGHADFPAESRFDAITLYSVECTHCGLSTDAGKTPDEVIALWNDRAVTAFEAERDALKARVAELESTLNTIRADQDVVISTDGLCDEIRERQKAGAMGWKVGDRFWTKRHGEGVIIECRRQYAYVEIMGGAASPYYADIYYSHLQPITQFLASKEGEAK